MLIAAFFLLGLLACLLAYGYRSRAHSAEARANRAEGALDETRDENSFLRGLTQKAIRYAAEAAKMNPDEVLPRRDPQFGEAVLSEVPFANYTPQLVANCSQCGVSVRHDPGEYPVKCPREGCGTLIDPTFDNPPEFS